MLKKIVLCVSFGLGVFVSNAQQVAIDFYRDKLYVGIPNDLRIIAEEIPCSALWVTCSRGVISGEDCNYTLIGRGGNLEIDVYYINEEDTIHISKHKEKVYKETPLVATIAGKSSGFISKNLLKRAPGIRADISIAGFPCVHHSVSSYFIVVFREEKYIYTEVVKGNTFSKDFKKACDTFKHGDKIYVFDVKARGPMGEASVNSIALKIQ